LVSVTALLLGWNIGAAADIGWEEALDLSELKLLDRCAGIRGLGGITGAGLIFSV
jgi:hypothetical protein